MTCDECPRCERVVEEVRTFHRLKVYIHPTVMVEDGVYEQRFCEVYP